MPSDLRGFFRKHEACHLMRDYISNFANPVRLRILCELVMNDSTVTELVDATGVRQSTVSQHLKQLRLSGLVGRKRTGNQRVYRITDPLVFETMEFFASLASQLVERGAGTVAAVG